MVLSETERIVLVEVDGVYYEVLENKFGDIWVVAHNVEGTDPIERPVEAEALREAGHTFAGCNGVAFWYRLVEDR